MDDAPMALTTRDAGSNAAIWLLYRNADYAGVNPHDAEVSESVQITHFRTVGSAGTSPTGMSCRGE
jgi:hypothetical protein